MKKYLVLILIIAFGIITNSCKKTDTPTNPDRPLTLAERAGTYTGKSSSTTVEITIGVKSDGSGYLQWDKQTPSNCQIGEATSTNTTFTFQASFTAQEGASKHNYTINFDTNYFITPNEDGVFNGAIFSITKQ